MFIVADAMTVAAYWGRWDIGVLRPLVTAAMGGILVGSLLISVVSEPVWHNIIAILMLLFAAFYTWNRRVVIPPQSLARCAWPAG